MYAKYASQRHHNYDHNIDDNDDDNVAGIQHVGDIH